MKNMLFSEYEGALVGMVVHAFQMNIKTRHATHILGMYVKREYRHQSSRGLLTKETSSAKRNNQTFAKVPLLNPL
jgi:hypothetical protein